MARLNACNVLNAGADPRQLWRFSAGLKDFNLAGEKTLPAPQALPAKWVAKDWSDLWSRKLNISWLPLDQVFLRVLQLPKCDPSELVSMVEFQIEKISPLPVAQIVWSCEPVPSRSKLPREMQTVVVAIASRDAVEAHLGVIEGAGYLADRIEIPFLHELLATAIDGDGAWVYLRRSGARHVCLAAWWYNGTLENLTLIPLGAPENFATEIREHLTQTAWAGELEGWLTAPPFIQFVADAESIETAKAISAAITAAMPGQRTAVLPAHNATQVATFSARRAASGQSRLNLMPAEFTARYHQKFIDGVWMRSIGALMMIYLFGLLAYFAWVQAVDLKRGNVEAEIEAISGSYTNALKARARIQVLQDQINLRRAALDGLKFVSEALPADLTLSSLVLQQGKTLTLRGSAPIGQTPKVTEYNSALAKLLLNGAPMFSAVNSPTIVTAPGGQSADWFFSCELRRKEGE
jgi:hypothetical protein